MGTHDPSSPSIDRPTGTFPCSCCGEMLSGPPMAWHFDAPIAWSLLSARDRKRRGELSTDLCVIDGEQFYLRGLVEIPVLECAEPFAWGVWVSLSRTSFQRAYELWNEERRVEEPSYFGWFSNKVPGYPDTLHLKTAVVFRAVGLRPYVELEPTDHPLALEQRHGISMARVREIAEQMHHHNTMDRAPNRERAGLH